MTSNYHKEAHLTKHQHQAQLSASGDVNPKGEFEILAITAGTGNGWEFSPAACRQVLHSGMEPTAL